MSPPAAPYTTSLFSRAGVNTAAQGPDRQPDRQADRQADQQPDQQPARLTGANEASLMYM